IVEELIIEKFDKKIGWAYRFLMIALDDVGLLHLLQQLDELVIHFVQYGGIVDRGMAKNTSVRQRIAPVWIELHDVRFDQITQIGMFAKRVYQFMRLCGINLLHFTTVVSKK